MSKNFLAFLVGLLLSLSAVPSFAAADYYSAWTYNTYAWPGLDVNNCAPGVIFYYMHAPQDNTTYWRTEMRKHECSTGWRGARYFYDYSDDGFLDYSGSGVEIAADGSLQSVPPLEPSTCSDGLISPSETGIDCGDPACIGDEVCTTYCPVGFNAETRTSSDGFTSIGCYSSDTSEYTIDAKLGICPNGLFKSLTDTNKCVEYYAPTMASNDYLDPPPVPVATADPWNVFTQDNTVGISSTVETVDGVTTEIVTTTETGTNTAGDSSEKITDVTTVTAADGTKTVTTNITTNKTYSGGTAVAGETTTITQTYDAAGNLTGSTSSGSTSESEPGLTDSFSAPGSPDGTGDVVDGALLDVFLDRWVSFSDSVSAAPVFTPLTTIFNGPDTTLKTPAFVLPMGSYGDKSFLLSDYDDTFDALGLLFIFLAVWSAARTVMGNGMSKNHV